MLITLLVVAFAPRPFGFTGTTVVTGSMTPGIQPGDVALVWPLDEYLPGHVILFPSPAHPDQLIMHRVIEVRSDGFLVTKGDANAVPDSTPVDPATVVGVGRILIPAIGLPIVWAVNGDILLVIATVILGALLVRGTLTIEFFPGTRKSRLARSVIETTVMVAMLAIATVVVVVGVSRSSNATFVDRSAASASWAMASDGQVGPACTIEEWTYYTWGFQASAEFRIVKHTSPATSAKPSAWLLEWRFTADEQATGSTLAKSVSQSGQAVTYEPRNSDTNPPGITVVAAQVDVASASDTFKRPADFLLDGQPCVFIPVTDRPDQIIVDPPTPVPTLMPSPSVPAVPAEPPAATPEPVPSG